MVIIHMKNWLEKILQFLLPKDEEIIKIENLSPSDLREEAILTNHNLPRNVLALFDYRNEVIKKAIWQLKYRGNRKIAELFAKCLSEEILNEISERNPVENLKNLLIIPVPISKRRRKERGFNQCELITEELKKLFNKDNFQIENKLLIKTNNTESQTKKNRVERLKNLQNCFELSDKEKIKNRNIIVIDDVTTTGATFEEITKTLNRNGTRAVLCFALAH